MWCAMWDFKPFARAPASIIFSPLKKKRKKEGGGKDKKGGGKVDNFAPTIAMNASLLPRNFLPLIAPLRRKSKKKGGEGKRGKEEDHTFTNRLK